MSTVPVNRINSIFSGSTIKFDIYYTTISRIGAYIILIATHSCIGVII